MNTAIELTERKNAQHHEGASYKTKAIDGKKPARKTTPNRNKKKNAKPKVWGSTPETAAHAKANFDKYQADYNKINYRGINPKFNVKTEEDYLYVLDHNKEGVKDYIKRLMTEDMKRHPENYHIPDSVKKRVAKQIAIRDAKKAVSKLNKKKQ